MAACGGCSGATSFGCGMYVTGLNPATGASGDTIVVTGGGLDQVTGITVGGLDAEFTITSANQVSVVIPEGVTTDDVVPVVVEGPGMCQVTVPVELNSGGSTPPQLPVTLTSVTPSPIPYIVPGYPLEGVVFTGTGLDQVRGVRDPAADGPYILGWFSAGMEPGGNYLSYMSTVSSRTATTLEGTHFWGGSVSDWEGYYVALDATSYEPVSNRLDVAVVVVPDN